MDTGDDLLLFRTSTGTLEGSPPWGEIEDDVRGCLCIAPYRARSEANQWNSEIGHRLVRRSRGSCTDICNRELHCADAEASVPTVVISTTRRPIDGVSNATGVPIVVAPISRPAVSALVWSADIIERFVLDAWAVVASSGVTSLASAEIGVPATATNVVELVVFSSVVVGVSDAVALNLFSPSGVDINVVTPIWDADTDTDTRFFRSTTCIEALEGCGCRG